MKHHLHLLLAASFAAISIGASAAAVHDWTATRIGSFDDSIEAADFNNAGQVAVWSMGPGPSSTERGFLFTPGSSGGLVDLGSFGGTRTTPRALNASGEVVGRSETADGLGHAFVYRGGRMQRLALPGERFGAAEDINDRGQVLVRSEGADDVSRVAIFHSAGPPTVLSSPGPLFLPGGINNRGQVFGTFSTPGDPTHRTFFYDNGRMIDIGLLGGGGHTEAFDMNGSGQIVGAANGRPFLYGEGKMTEIRLSTPAPTGYAEDINDRGQVLGVFERLPEIPGAFLYFDGQAHDLGDLGGGRGTIAGTLNELGQVVGLSASSDGLLHAFFYSDGKMTDLTQWLQTSFSDVATTPLLFQGFSFPELNDLGQIAIPATLTNGQQTLFVLTPIPEPSTYALMLAGLGTLAWIARRQRAVRGSTGASSSGSAATSPRRAASR